MYFIFVSDDKEAIGFFENELQKIDAKKVLITLDNGFDLINFLQNVGKGRSYPELIILTPKFLRLGGMDLLELLKTDDIYRLIPVMILLPENNVLHEERCNRLMTDFIPAPTTENEWNQAVSKMCTSVL